MIRLFFIPYAGGSASTFSYWKNYISSECELVVIDLPGHGKQMMMDPCEDSDEVIEYLYSIIKSYQLDSDDPYYIAGHCMGAVLGYLLAHQIQQRGEFAGPDNLIFSGHNPPDDFEGIGKWHELSDEELIAELIATKMFPEELLKDEFASVILPIIKSDSALYHKSKWEGEPKPIKYKATILYGKEDRSVMPEKLERWQEFVKKKINIVACEGGHYFIEDPKNEYLDYINKMIENDIAQNSINEMM